jgi:DNA-binding IclR family transcriptional regulator
MFNLFGSKTKAKIFLFLSNNPNTTVNNLVKETKVKYKYAYKILSEFVEKGILDKINTKYSLSSRFVEFFRKSSDIIGENYINESHMKNRLDLFNTFCFLEEDEKVKAKVDGILNEWFFKKIDDW